MTIGVSWYYRWNLLYEKEWNLFWRNILINWLANLFHTFPAIYFDLAHLYHANASHGFLRGMNPTYKTQPTTVFPNGNPRLNRESPAQFKNLVDPHLKITNGILTKFENFRMHERMLQKSLWTNYAHNWNLNNKLKLNICLFHPS